jgi:hypothetical protein
MDDYSLTESPSILVTVPNFTNIEENNLMKLGGSLGNVPQKLKKLFIKTRYISEC